MSVRVFAPAKINLTLEVGAPRADGYHPLQSAVVFAGEGDWIEASASPALTLSVSGPFGTTLDGADDNLVLRAARLLDPARGARIHLEKNLPIASGVGGGSSDAAAALIALNEVWGLKRPIEDLARISAALGADVPVCVHRRSAWMSGVGEMVESLEAPALRGVLVNPGKPLSTPSVFRRFDEMKLGSRFAPRSAPVWGRQAAIVQDVQDRGNDLEAPAVALMPELGELLAILRAEPQAIVAALSGSGATCFALTGSAEDAATLANALSARNRDWWVRATTFGAP